MAYVALYRKYRSQSFGEVLGQEHVTTVLRNAIRMGRIAHAYLFCGPRGCGKTTTARLLARALNCQAGDAPTADPCGECEMCRRIRDGSAIDVVEMDAASETGIDDVREKIIENAKYLPAEARYKVYIIDEVHDLSLKAFDSLLKTLEEPPAHVVFVLATTEAHKVPITVRSRCQRMDFRRGALTDLLDNLSRVMQQESVEYDEEALVALARAAEGSFRDSLSLLEQALAYTDGRLTADAVHASVGTVGPALLDGITDVLASDDMGAVLAASGQLVDSGKDVKQTLIALQAHLRDLLVACVAAGPDALANVSPERFAQLRAQAERFGPRNLLAMLSVLADAERDIRFTNQQRLLLERALWSILPSNLGAQGPAGPSPASAPSAVPAHASMARPPAAVAPVAPPAAAPARPPANPRPAPERHAVAPSPASDPLVSAPGSPDPRFADGIDLDGIRRAWPRVVKRILQKSRGAVAYFGSETIAALEGHTVIVEFPDSFKLERVNSPRPHDLMEKMLAEEIGPGYRIRCVLAQALREHPHAPPAPAAGGRLDLPPAGAPPAVDPGSAPPGPEPEQATTPEDDFLRLVIEEFEGKEVNE